MIRKLLLTAAAIFVGKKLMERTRTGANSDTSPAQPGATGGHVPTDLMTDRHPDLSKRAAEPFRPDPHAPVAPEDREAMRPATIPIVGG